MMETASWPSCTIAAVCLSGLLTLLSPVVWAVSNVEDEGQGNKVLQEKVKGSQAVRLSVEGISASAGEDEPLLAGDPENGDEGYEPDACRHRFWSPGAFGQHLWVVAVLEPRKGRATAPDRYHGPGDFAFRAACFGYSGARRSRA